jgi:hypothetical protein
VIVSGDNQEAMPGTELPAPLVVRVMKLESAVPDVPVTWTVESGGGELLSATTLTDQAGTARARLVPQSYRVVVRAVIGGAGEPAARFNTVPPAMASYTRFSPSVFCPGSGVGGCQHYRFFRDGTFELWYSSGPAYHGVFVVRDTAISLAFNNSSWSANATIRGDSLLIAYDPSASLSDFEDGTFVLDKEHRGPINLSAVLGDGLDAQAGGSVDHSLRVLITDSDGSPIRGQAVAWRVVSGSAEIFPGGLLSFPDGSFAAYIRPMSLGSMTVTAQVVGGLSLPVVFHVSAHCWASVVPVTLWRDAFGAEDAFNFGFAWGPLTIGLGATVEWINTNVVGDGTARIQSVAVPPGGTAFDSGILQPTEHFRFTPNVQGTWEYQDAVGHVQGRLNVQGVLGEPRCPQ